MRTLKLPNYAVFGETLILILVFLQNFIVISQSKKQTVYYNIINLIYKLAEVMFIIYVVYKNP